VVVAALALFAVAVVAVVVAAVFGPEAGVGAGVEQQVDRPGVVGPHRGGQGAGAGEGGAGLEQQPQALALAVAGGVLDHRAGAGVGVGARRQQAPDHVEQAQRPVDLGVVPHRAAGVDQRGPAPAGVGPVGGGRVAGEGGGHRGVVTHDGGGGEVVAGQVGIGGQQARGPPGPPPDAGLQDGVDLLLPACRSGHVPLPRRPGRYRGN
jgi:hypothetical protein